MRWTRTPSRSRYATAAALGRKPFARGTSGDATADTRRSASCSQLPLAGEAAHTWLIADAVVHTDLERDGLHWLFPAGGALMLFPFPDPGKWRLLDTTGEGEPEHLDQIARQFSTKLSQALGRDTVVDSPELGVEVHHPAARGPGDARRAVFRLR